MGPAPDFGILLFFNNSEDWPANFTSDAIADTNP
jgi:cupin superfamily acireductone dioxygenase involved in methionine salvage